jgi:hypothetical protein
MDCSVSCRCSVAASEFVGCCPSFEDATWFNSIASGDKELQIELLEWVGAVHSECCSLMSGDCEGRTEPAFTSHRACRLHQVRVEGLLAPCSIFSIVSHMVDAVACSAMPWVLLTLFGHEDSPSAWKNSQHAGDFRGSECHVSVLLFQGNSSQVTALLFESVGAADSRV